MTAPAYLMLLLAIVSFLLGFAAEHQAGRVQEQLIIMGL